ncbi:MAG: hypothetical protein ABSE48_14675 [Verrucomicrobiota bacterium]
MKTLLIVAVYLSISIYHSSLAQSIQATARIGTDEHLRTVIRVRQILLNMKMPDGLGDVSMTEQIDPTSKRPTIYGVQLPIGRMSYVDSLGLQVWLLRADGTAFPQSGLPSRISTATIGQEDDMFYTFTKRSPAEPVGIVLRVKGKLYSAEIKAEGK